MIRPTALDGSGAAAQVAGERSGSPAHQPPPPYNPMWATHTFGPLEQGKCLQFSFNSCLVVLASAMLNNNTHITDQQGAERVRNVTAERVYWGGGLIHLVARVLPFGQGVCTSEAARFTQEVVCKTVGKT